MTRCAPLLLLTLTSSAHAAPPEFFMPAFEAGVVVHADPARAVGVVFRTAVDFRPKQNGLGFVRLTYDTTSGRTRTQPVVGPTLVANAVLHDVLVGGGLRGGSKVVQGIGAVQAGLEVGELPVATYSDDGTVVSLETQTSFAPIFGVATALEVYVAPRVAITAEAGLRFPTTRLAAEGLRGLFTLGVTTPL